MRLLLDTHIALWAVIDDPKLPLRARDLIAETENEVYVSAASVWEIAIKHARSRGIATDMPVSAPEALSYFREAGYILLAISPDHAAAVADLPPRHADPFDRILVAQALTEPLRLITRDPIVACYSDTIIRV